MKEQPWGIRIAAVAFATAAGLGSHVEAAGAVNSCKTTAGAALRSCKASIVSTTAPWRCFDNCGSVRRFQCGLLAST